MRLAALIVVSLSAAALPADSWWQEMFLSEDAPSPPRPELLDAPALDASLRAARDADRGLLWMRIVTQSEIDAEEVFSAERELREANDVVAALLMRTPARRDASEDLEYEGFHGGEADDLGCARHLDLDALRSLVAHYQESQGRRLAPVKVGQTMVVPATFEEEEPVVRWIGRNILPALPDLVVEWGRDLGLQDRVSWSASRNLLGGEPTLLDRHAEESVKQVEVRVMENLHFEVGLRRELLNSQPEDDLFEGGSGSSEPFASLLWKF